MTFDKYDPPYCILHQQWSCLVLLKMTFLWTSICSTNRIYSPLELLTLVTSYLNIDRCRSLNSSQDKPEEMSKHAWLHFWPRLSGFQMQCFKKINQENLGWTLDIFFTTVRLSGSKIWKLLIKTIVTTRKLKLMIKMTSRMKIWVSPPSKPGLQETFQWIDHQVDDF